MEEIRISQSGVVESYTIDGCSKTCKKFNIAPTQLYRILRMNNIPLKRPASPMKKRIILEE